MPADGVAPEVAEQGTADAVRSTVSPNGPARPSMIRVSRVCPQGRDARKDGSGALTR